MKDHASSRTTPRTFLDCTIVSTEERLVIRPPVAYYVAAGVFLLLSWLLPWIMVQCGLLDQVVLPLLASMLAVGIGFFALLLGRGWTLDRKTDSVRYFPWRLCALTAIRGIRVVERRIGKLGLGRAFTVDLNLQDGRQVRFAGFAYARLGSPEAHALATIVGEWLNVPVTTETLTPTVVSHEVIRKEDSHS